MEIYSLFVRTDLVSCANNFWDQTSAKQDI